MNKSNITLRLLGEILGCWQWFKKAVAYTVFGVLL